MGFLFRKGLDRHSDRTVHDHVQYMQQVPVHPDVVLVSQRMHATAEDVVLGHHLNDVESIFYALCTVLWRGALPKVLSDGPIIPEFK